MIPEVPNNEPQWRDALRKILLLEEHKGFADTAVSGGIRRFVDLWESELREYLADQPEKIGELIERQYRDLSGEQRRAWVEAWRRAISQAWGSATRGDRRWSKRGLEPAGECRCVTY